MELNQLGQKVEFLERVINRLEKMIDGNGDSIVTKFEKLLDRHVTTATAQFDRIDSEIDNLKSNVTSLQVTTGDNARRITDLETKFNKSQDVKDSVSTQLIILLAVTLLNLILGGIKLFGG